MARIKKNRRTLNDYRDMLDMPRHQSTTRSKMPIKDRAAQFSPFAAVVGHETAVKEAARLTKAKKILDETEKAVIDDTLQRIDQRRMDGDNPVVEITFFEPDPLKAGGAYRHCRGKIKKVDIYEGKIIFVDGTKIEIEEIYHVEIE